MPSLLSNALLLVVVLLRQHSVVSGKEFDVELKQTTDFRRLQYTTPSMRDFTVCWWMKPTSARLVTILSYATARGGDNTILIHLNLKAKSVLLYLMNKHDYAAHYGKHGLNVTTGEWTHLCLVWDHEKVSGSVLMHEKTVPLQRTRGSGASKDYFIPREGVYVVGVDQDVVGGGFGTDDEMDGRINRLQMWNRKLDHPNLEDQLFCEAPEGNVLAWTQTPWFVTKNTQVESTIPCTEGTCDAE